MRRLHPSHHSPACQRQFPVSDRILRHAQLSDAAALAQLAAIDFSDNWSAEFWCDQIGEQGSIILVAQQSGRLVGYLHVRRVIDEAEILSIATLPAFRRQGIARELLALAVTELRDSPPCHLFLEVSVKNGPATRMYTALGFNEIGIRKGYYRQPQAPPVDAIVMALDISE